MEIFVDFFFGIFRLILWKEMLLTSIDFGIMVIL